MLSAECESKGDHDNGFKNIPDELRNCINE